MRKNTCIACNNEFYIKLNANMGKYPDNYRFTCCNIDYMYNRNVLIATRNIFHPDDEEGWLPSYIARCRWSKTIDISLTNGFDVKPVIVGNENLLYLFTENNSFLFDKIEKLLVLL